MSVASGVVAGAGSVGFQHRTLVDKVLALVLGFGPGENTDCFGEECSKRAVMKETGGGDSGVDYDDQNQKKLHQKANIMTKPG